MMTAIEIFFAVIILSFLRKIHVKNDAIRPRGEQGWTRGHPGPSEALRDILPNNRDLKVN